MKTEKITFDDGRYSIFFFLDGQGNPVDKDQATQFESHDYSKSGKEIGRSYGTIDHEAKNLAFDPSQPRDPKGSATGGQWTSASDERAQSAWEKLKKLKGGQKVDVTNFLKAKLTKEELERAEDFHMILDAIGDDRAIYKLQAVKLDRLAPAESYVVRQHLANMLHARHDLAGVSAPRIVQYRGKHVLMDGTHRAAAAKLLGAKDYVARVYDYSAMMKAWDNYTR